MPRESSAVDFSAQPLLQVPLSNDGEEVVDEVAGQRKGMSAGMSAGTSRSTSRSMSRSMSRDVYRSLSFSGHKCTCTLLLLLLGIFGGILGVMVMYLIPLTDKAHEVGDEALHVADVAKSKITNIDLQINDFLTGGNAKLMLVEEATKHVKDATDQVSLAVATVHELSARMHLVLNELNQTNTEMRQQMEQTQQQTSIIDAGGVR
tara:strand:- start:806 stop:1420 length:615 start_codon:yes stop_codon:yes gene_type:complete